MPSPLQAIAQWADDLNADPAWVASLNGFFDKIGLTEDYLKEHKSRPTLSTRTTKAIKDNVWGMVELDPAVLFVLDSPIVQRLHLIKQLGFSYLTYPGAVHTRFEHSIGAVHVTERLLEAFRRSEAAEKRTPRPTAKIRAVSYAIGSLESRLALLAALLHDVGHLPFSHATESYFEKNELRTNIGPYSIRDFRARFRRAYASAGIGKRKQLSELISAAIVTSARFQFLLSIAYGSEENSVSAQNPRTASHKIATLILGERIDDLDYALPAVISGPFDADKIDYMLRDARACGVGIGIDISRIFLRAAAFEVASIEAFANYSRSEPDEVQKITQIGAKLFLLDQARGDGLNELAAARASLYQRVYHHQLTLNAEAQYSDLLDKAREVGRPDENPAAQLLTALSLDDASLMHELRRSGDVGVREAAFALSTRRLLKRGAFISIDVLRSQLSGYTENKRAWAPWLEEIEKFRQYVFNELMKQIREGSAQTGICELIKVECGSLKKALLAKDWPESELPDDELPSVIRLIAPLDPVASNYPTALALSTSAQIIQTEDRGPTYAATAALGRERAFLLAPADWRDLALLATQRVLYRALLGPSQGEPPQRAQDNSRSLAGPTDSPLILAAMFRPILDIRDSANACGLDWRGVIDLQTRLSNLYRSMPALIAVVPDKRYEKLGGGFQSVQGEKDWKIRPAGGSCKEVEGFLNQFPEDLREAAVTMLQHVTVLDRDTVVDYVLKAIRKFPVLAEHQRVYVPLSPSSGSQIWSFIKLQAEVTRSICEHLDAAISRTKDGDEIVFFDDNIASGSQLTKQFRIWASEIAPKESSANYWSKPLTKASLGKLKSRKLLFAFAVGNDSGEVNGVQRAAKELSELGFQVSADSIRFHYSLLEVSGKKDSAFAIGDDLRGFLRTVGVGVRRCRPNGDLLSPSVEVFESECQRKALGYDNLEGLLVTAFNVPSSTYTALWCPGRYSPDPDSPDWQLPWRPLFLRSGEISNVILA